MITYQFSLINVVNLYQYNIIKTLCNSTLDTYMLYNNIDTVFFAYTNWKINEVTVMIT